MKIYFIIDDTNFFIPDYLAGVVSQLEADQQILGLTPIRQLHGPTIYSYITRNIWLLSPLQIIKLAITYFKTIIGKICFDYHLTDKPYTIEQVAKKYQIPIFNFPKINHPEFIKHLKQLNTDLVISSCSAIFKTELLKAPKYGCINRHSALLPSYGGLFPIFQAMINQESLLGVTVHYMVEKIDQGQIIYQDYFKAHPNDSLFYNYQLSYQLSIPVTVAAVRAIKSRNFRVIKSKSKPSYYSFPTADDWQRFFKLKLKFI